MSEIVAWGRLQYQLFEVELCLKHGLQRSLVASALAAGLFVLSYALEQLIEVSSLMLGLAIAAWVTEVFQPLHRAAGRLADRITPGADESAPSLSDRRREVCQNAVEAALLDGEVRNRERAMPGQLRKSLGIVPTEAGEIDASAARALG